MSDLLPCPFCNSSAVIERNGKWKYGYCPSCGAQGPADLGESGAIEQWNSRPREQELENLHLQNIKGDDEDYETHD